MSPIGGMTPWIGFHSVMERPDSVSRVAPPTSTSTNSVNSTKPSHRRTWRRLRSVLSVSLWLRYAVAVVALIVSAPVPERRAARHSGSFLASFRQNRARGFSRNDCGVDLPDRPVQNKARTFAACRRAILPLPK
nr:hypothetical protein SHINE37_40943 [Rhizobiaceae bacterium]